MTPFLQTAGWALIHFVWQGAAIAAVIALALRLLERRSANARYIVACAGLAAMLAAPAVTARLLWTADGAVAAATTVDAPLLTRSITTGADAPFRLLPKKLKRSQAETPAASRDGDPATPVRFERIVRAVAIAWLVGVVALLGRMAGGWWQVRRLHRAALATNASPWQSACRRLAYRIGLPAAAHVVESALVDVPTVVGWLRPAIILPVAALAALSPSQVEAILAHELAHIRRHDYAVNVLQTIAETLLFYHPAMWWLSSRIRAEREHCCDDVAVAICGDAVGYARALAELESLRTMSASMAMVATGGSLMDRVRRILRVPATDEPRSASWAATLALTMIFTAGAGGVQHVPWSALRGDARGQDAAATSTSKPREAVAARRRAEREGDGNVSQTATNPALEGIAGGITVGIANGVLGGVTGGILGGVTGGVVGGIQPPRPPEPPQPPEPPEPPEPPTPPEPPEPPAPPAPPAAPAYPAPAPPAPPAPPAHPAPPAPPVPPAPPAPPADGFSLSAGHRRMSWSDNGVRFDVEIEGSVTFDDDLTDVESLSPGGWLKIRDRSGIVPHTVEITSVGGTLKHEYFVGGLSRGWNDEGRRFLATMLPTLVRRSGLGAESRAKAIFARKGVAGVMDEIDLLGSDYARRLYLTTLVDIAHFDSITVQPVLQRASDIMRSDYDKRQVLQHVASRITLNQRGVSAYVRTIASMKSDYDKRESLNMLTKSGAALDGNTAFEAVSGMKSSYDKRMVLLEIVQHGGDLSTDTKRTLLRSVAEPQSDYDRRQVLTAYVKKFGIEAGVRDAFFAAVDAMRSDYDRAETLLTSLNGGTVDSVVRSAFVASAERLKSSYDQNRVLAALVRAERR